MANCESMKVGNTLKQSLLQKTHGPWGIMRQNDVKEAPQIHVILWAWPTSPRSLARILPGLLWMSSKCAVENRGSELH